MSRRDDYPDDSLGGADSAVQDLADLKKRGVVRRLVLGLPDWMTANRVTVFRMLLAVPVWFLIGAAAYGWALGLFLFAMLLDAVDGAIAEARGQHSVFGAFVDPLADKVLVCAALLAILPAVPWVFHLPVFGICLFAAGLTLARVLKLVWFRESKRAPGTAPPVAAKLAGKAKCWFEVAAIVVLLVGLAAASEYTVWTGFFLVTIAMCLGSVSWWSQFSDLWKLKRVKRPARPAGREKRQVAVRPWPRWQFWKRWRKRQVVDAQALEEAEAAKAAKKAPAETKKPADG